LVILKPNKIEGFYFLNQRYKNLLGGGVIEELL